LDRFYVVPWHRCCTGTFSRFDKLDLVFIAFIYFALVIEALR
jgi:hypothetical protein